MTQRMFTAAERTPLNQAWADYLESAEYRTALYHARNGDADAAMFQAFAYAFAAGSLRPKAHLEGKRP